jgi:uncharacterized membrane protein
VTSLYTWLKFLHVAGLAAFLFGHGIAAAAALVLRGRPVDSTTSALLRASINSYAIAYPGLLVLVVTGVWMGFLGSWWRSGWIWTAIAVLVAVFVAMSALSVPYHRTRDALAKNESNDQIASLLQKSRPIALAVIGALGLIVIIFLMVFKPL